MTYNSNVKKKNYGDHCAAFGCSHKRSHQLCSLLSFPKEEAWRVKWVVAMRRCSVDGSGQRIPGKLWTPKSHHRLCTCHFSKPPKPKRRYSGWNHIVPDRFSFHQKNDITDVRSQRRRGRESTKVIFIEKETCTPSSETITIPVPASETVTIPVPASGTDTLEDENISAPSTAKLPPDFGYIFQAHRADGKRKLGPFDVSTLFCPQSQPKRRKQQLPTRCVPAAQMADPSQMRSEHAYCAAPPKTLSQPNNQIESNFKTEPPEERCCTTENSMATTTQNSNAQSEPPRKKRNRDEPPPWFQKFAEDQGKLMSELIESQKEFIEKVHERNVILKDFTEVLKASLERKK